MSSIFDSPGPAVSFEPVFGVQCLKRQVGDEANGLVFASDMLPGQQSGLSRKGKANVFRRYGAALECAAFGHAFILLQGSCAGGRRHQRGKIHSAGWEPFGRCFGAEWADYSSRSVGNALRVP